MSHCKSLTVTIVTKDDKTITLDFNGAMAVEWNHQLDIDRLCVDGDPAGTLYHTGNFDFSLKAHGRDDKVAANGQAQLNEYFDERDAKRSRRRDPVTESMDRRE